MTRIDEITAAMKSGPVPMFLIGIAVLGQQDFDGIYRNVALAGEKFYRDQEKSADASRALLEKMRARKA